MATDRTIAPRRARTGVVVLTLLAGSVAFAQWSPDQRMTASGAATSTFGSAWCMGAGSSVVHVVWSDVRDGNAEVYYKRSTDRGQHWTADVRLTYNSGQSWNPCIACVGQVLHVAWSDTRYGNLEVLYKRSSDGGYTWGPDTRLTTDQAWSWYPALAAQDSSVYLVALSDGLVLRRSTNSGSSWLPATTLSAGAYLTPGPSIAVADDCVFTVWVSDRDGNEEIYFKRSTDRGATWGTDTRLTNDSHVSCDPSIAASGSGVHVVWSDDRVTSGSEVFYVQSLDNGLTWSGEQQLSDGPDWSNRPSVVASDANVHVVWQDARTGDLEIFYRRSTDSGVSWGHEDWLTSDPSSSYYPTLALADTTVYVVWTDERDGGSDIFFKRNPTGNPPSVTESREVTARPVEGQLRVVPSLFSVSARAVDREAEWFSVYDAAGELVSICLGSRIGFGLPAGAYYVRSRLGVEAARILKLR